MTEKSEIKIRKHTKSLDEFAQEVNLSPEEKKYKDKLPWLRDGVRPDVKQYINLCVYEPYRLKLKFISKNSSYSQQSFVREVLEKAIDKKIEQLLT